MTNEIQKTELHNAAVFNDLAQFESAQRIATALSKATNVPEAYQNNIPNILVALEMAYRMNASPLMVMQNLDIIHGKPAFNAKFTIAMINACGRYTPLRFRFSGSGDSRTCQAYATELATGEELSGPVASIAMAKSEGWYDRKGSKWRSMPDLMLTYRAAAFWSRIYEAGLTMGMHTAEEIHDISNAGTGAKDKAADLNERLAFTEAKVEDVSAPVISSTDQSAPDPFGL